MKSTVLLIFGNPKVGTLLMQEGDHTKALYRDPHVFPTPLS
ncbi:hypothetical protein [Limosilactobacillus fermentum]